MWLTAWLRRLLTRDTVTGARGHSLTRFQFPEQALRFAPPSLPRPGARRACCQPYISSLLQRRGGARWEFSATRAVDLGDGEEDQ